MRAQASAVLFREARRSARRWQTHGLRVLFTAALVAMVLVALLGSPMSSYPPSDHARIGQGLFYGYISTQAAVAALLAPVLVATGLQEEKDERTLELLVLTRLGTAHLLWGKVLARLAVLLTVVLGGTPVLALILTFGGVDVWEVVSATVQTVVVVISLGAVGGFVALFSRGAILPLLAAAVYALGAYLVVPAFYATIAYTLSGMTSFPGAVAGGHLSPLLAMLTTDWTLVLPTVAALPVLTMIGSLGVPVFRIQSTGGDWAVSPDIWAWERFKSRLLMVGVGGVLALPVVVLVVAYRWLPDPGSLVLVWLWCEGAILVGTGALLGGLWWLTGRVRDLVAPMRRSWGLRPYHGLRPRRKGLVRGNPITWLELRGRADLTARLARWGLLGGMGVLVFLFWLAEGFDDDLFELTMVLGLVVGALLTALTATSSLLDDRRRGTLPLLAATTLSSARIVWGRLCAVGVRSLPVVVVALGCWATQLDYWHPDELTDLWPASAPARIAANTLWALSVWAVLVLLYTLVAVRNPWPRLTWPAILAVTLGYLSLPVWFGLVAELTAVDLFDAVVRVWLPITSDTGYGVSLELLLGIQLQLAVATLLFLVLAWRWRAWATRELR